MDETILKADLNAEGEDYCDYVDVPEIVAATIKQEINEEGSEFSGCIKVKEEPVLKFEKQLLGHIKTEYSENEETLAGYKTEEKFCTKTRSLRSFVKTEENCSGGSSLIKIEEVNIKEEEDESSAPSVKRKGAKKELEDDNILQCPKCNYQTIRRGFFTRHLQICNAYEYKNGVLRKFVLKCPECQYQTFAKHNLSRHILVHKKCSEIRMYKCDQCEFQTKYKTNLNLHSRRHKTKGEAGMLKCTQCAYQTFVKNNLVLHVLRHENAQKAKTHKCLECGYITLKKNHLKFHALLHKNPEDIEIFKCDQCDYQTKRKGDLNRHLLCHIGR